MAYTPHTWTAGETIDAAKLNANEQGTQAAAAAADTANSGLTSKVNSSTYTAGLAAKADMPAGGTDGQSLVKSGSTTAWATVSGGGTVTDASTTAKGVVQLAGDLAGTAAAPTVPGLAGKLAAANNLSDVANAATARTNLGLGTAATSAATVFDAAGAATAAQAAAVQRANHTGTQAASTITGLSAVATSGAYADLSGKPAALPTQTGSSGKFLTTDGTNPSWATPAIKYFPSLNVYNLSDTSFAKWRLAYAQQRNGSRQAILACLGDSITAGSTNITGDKYAFSYPGRLRTYLETKTGVVASTGLAIANIGDPNKGFPSSAITQSTTGTWNNVSGYGPYMGVYGNSTGGTYTVTWTGSQTLRVWFLQGGGGGTTTTTLDGTASTSFSSSGAFVIGRVDYVPTGSGAHTWVGTAPTGGSAYLVGFELRQNTTSGVQVYNLGIASQTSTGFAGNNSNTGGALTGLQALTPDLTIILLGTNDGNGAAVPVSTYTTNMQTIITSAQASGDVMLMTPPRANNPAASPNAFADYCNALYALADTNNCPVLDLRNRYSVNPGSYMDSIGHMSNTGAFDLAAAAMQVVGLQVGA